MSKPKLRNNYADFHKPLIIGGTTYQTFNQEHEPLVRWKDPSKVPDTWAEVQAGRERGDDLYAGLGQGTAGDIYPETRRGFIPGLSKVLFFKEGNKHPAHY